MRQIALAGFGKGRKAIPLGVDKEHLDLPQPVVHGQREGHAAGQGGLAGAGCPGDQDVSYFGRRETQEQGQAGLVHTQQR